MRFISLLLFGIVCATLGSYVVPPKQVPKAQVSLDKIEASYVKTQKLLDKVYKDCGFDY